MSQMVRSVLLAELLRAADRALDAGTYAENLAGKYRPMCLQSCHDLHKQVCRYLNSDLGLDPNNKQSRVPVSGF